MGKSGIGNFQAMRCLLICSLLILLANCITAADVIKNEKVKLGKRTCTCTFTMETKGSRCSGQAKCDKKCTGTGAVDVDSYSFTLAVKKGKGKISKCTVAAMPTVGPVEPTGSGSGPVPTGSGSGPVPPTGSGSGMENPMSRCTCVGNGGSGPTPPTGSGTGPGSGSSKQKVLPWFLGMTPVELCVETGTAVVFNKTGHNVVPMSTQADYDGCTGFLGDNPTVGDNINPFTWQADTLGTYYFACGVGTHCSAGGMKAQISVAMECVKRVTVPWSFGMETVDICVETGTSVVFEWTGSGHNVNLLSSKADYDTCTGFTDTQGNSGPYIYQGDTPGVFYFACGLGAGFHCNNGNMKAQVTVADI